MLHIFIRLVLILFVFFSSVFAQDEFFEPKTTVGGYGELHYNYSKTKSSDADKVLDFHRFVLFFSHSWTEKWSFKSEIELEHNLVEGGKSSGELELEQAYVNYHYSEAFGFQAGVVLPSIGILNEYHEPPLFLSVERPDYSKNIIPTTWFGNGTAIYGYVNGFSYKAVIMEGLDGTEFNNNGIRGGRQKGLKSNAQELLYNIRIDYTNVAGLKIGGSFIYNDAIAGKDSTIGTSIFEIHAQYNAHNFISVFEYGHISFDGADAGFIVENAMGYYFDLGYNIAPILNSGGKIIPWFRYTDYNTAASVIGGGIAEKEMHYSKWMVGLAYKPIDPVVYKVDYGIQTKELGKAETKLFNIGVGYMF